MDIRIAALHYYPIKSCAGTGASSMMLEDMGFAYDRRWMVVRADDRRGLFISQRDFPVMALIRPAIQGEVMIVTLPGLPELRVSIHEENLTKRRAITVWKYHGGAFDVGDEAANWFSAALGVPCRLVYSGSSFVRIADGRIDGPNLPKVGFADGYAVLLASESSLADLNSRLDAAIPMDRFRANLIIVGDDLPPWAEDSWSALQLPNSGRTLRIAKPCARCSVTTVDQSTGRLTGPEPLKTLSEFRRVEDNKVMFGSNLIYDSYQKPIKISVGDPLVPLERE